MQAFDRIWALTEIADNYDLVLFDLWGVLIEGSSLYPGVAAAVNSLMKKKDVLFVSNSPRINAATAERMREFGINCKDEQMFTSGQMSKDLLDDSQDSMIYHLAHGGHVSAIVDAHRITSDIFKASSILITAHLEEGEDLDMFNQLFEEAIKRGIKGVCPNPDKIIPNMGKLRYCPGYFADIYEKMGGEVVTIGKPGRDIFLGAIASVNPRPSLERVLMIGDTLEMDILGAKNAGISSALVLTGNVAAVIAGCDSEVKKVEAVRRFCIEHALMPDLLVDIIR